MTDKSVFTEAEWSLLSTLAEDIAGLVAAAAPGGTLRESAAIGAAMVEAQGLFVRTPLILQLLEGIDTVMRGPAPTTKRASFEQRKDWTLDRARQAVLLLAQKATPHELDAYRRYINLVAERVATAAEEGGFLGIGGTRVTAAERETLHAIQEAIYATLAGEATAPRQVSVRLTYLLRMALPPNAIVTARLVDLDAGQTAQVIINEQTFTTKGRQVPFQVTLPYQAGAINPGHEYAVQANISVDGTPWFVEATTYRVVTQGHPVDLEVFLKRVE